MSELNNSSPPEVPMKTDDRLRKRVREVLSYMAAFAALCGIGLGILEYYQRKALTRSNNTMEQIAYWDSAGARDAYRALSNEVAAILPNVSDSELAAAAENPKIMEKLRKNLVSGVYAANAKAPEHVDNVVYFFSRLGLCIKAKLCDAKAADIFFEDTLTAFLDVFRNELKRRAEIVQGYDEAVLELETTFQNTKSD